MAMFACRPRHYIFRNPDLNMRRLAGSIFPPTISLSLVKKNKFGNRTKTTTTQQKILLHPNVATKRPVRKFALAN